MTNKISGGSLHALRISMIGCLLLSCTAERPNIYYDLGGHKDTLAPGPDWPAKCNGAPLLSPPVIDPYPNPTSYALQAFRGRLVGAAQIIARSGAGTAKPATVSADGKFCIEVQLLPDSPNTVYFQGVDANGCPGRETQINITHKSSTKQDGGISAPMNLAKHVPITSDNNPEGQLTNVNDGDTASFAKFSYLDWNPMNSCDKHVWVRVDLGKVYTISKIKIVWAQGAGGDYAKCYAVLLSAATSPVEPSTSNSDWKVVKQDGNNTDIKDIVISINPEPARWAALLLYDNNSTGLYETFQLAEFEVWGQDPNAVPPPPPDRCQ